MKLKVVPKSEAALSTRQPRPRCRLKAAQIRDKFPTSSLHSNECDPVNMEIAHFTEFVISFPCSERSIVMFVFFLTDLEDFCSFYWGN